MSVDITIDAGRGRIWSRLSGRLSRETLRQYYHALYAHPQFQPTMSEVFDVSGVTDIDLTAEEIRDFSATTAGNTSKGEGVRVAIVAPTDLTFGLARLYELSQIDSTNRLCVLRTRAEAEAWLDGRADDAGAEG